MKPLDNARCNSVTAVSVREHCLFRFLCLAVRCNSVASTNARRERIPTQACQQSVDRGCKATVSADFKTVHWWLHVFMTGKSCFPLQIAIATRF
uniref:Uncharacterized protein n=1 Tax=Myoviridae sp. ct4tH12 TaxID=2825031 RepID=A0A8S5PXG3_9CAUD|nr:MAG TPA: hypothetical protein [Myoviridae sp. ct4tH12]